MLRLLMLVDGILSRSYYSLLRIYYQRGMDFKLLQFLTI
jgi:hypothetical protein